MLCEPNTDEGKRKYFTYLMARDQDEEAKRLIEELVASTGDINDAISLLNFCVTNNIGPDKVECAKNSFKIIENKASQLNFHQAYSTAEMVESLKNNKLAGILYQQALDKYFEYTPNKEVKLMSENQLTIKIEDLKK